MTLQGTLEAFPLTDILQLLSLSQKSGALHLRGEGSGLAYFHNGEIYFATSRGHDALGTALVRAGVVDEGTWKAVVADTRRQKSLGDALLRNAAIDQDRFQAFLRDRVEEAIFDLLRWERGRFDFRPGENHSLGPVFTFPVDSLIAEGRRRIDEWVLITEVVPSVRAVVDMVRTLPEDHHEVTLTRDEWRALSFVDGRRSVTELAVLLGDGEFRTMQTLHGLVAAGLVSVLARPVDDRLAEMPELEDDAPATNPVGLADNPVPMPAAGDDAPSAADEAHPFADGPPPFADEVDHAALGVDEPPPADAPLGVDEPPPADAPPDTFDTGTAASAEPAPEPAPQPAVSACRSEPEPAAGTGDEDDELAGLSLAEAAAALEDSLDDGVEEEVVAPGVVSRALEELEALSEEEPPTPEFPLVPSVSGDLFSEIEERVPTTLDGALLSEALAATPAAPVADPRDPSGSSMSADTPRIGTAALAREFSQISAGSGPIEGANALETEPPVEHERDGEEAPTPKTAGLNKTLILRLISGVKDL